MQQHANPKLNVPFRSQHDGSHQADSNCGPAALSMALAVFGVKSDTATIRERCDALDPPSDPDDGVTFRALSTIASEAGLTPISSEAWSLDTLRWHLEHGHPVVVGAEYRLLTGHSRCAEEGAHCVLVIGMTPDGFIYSDPDYKTRGRGHAVKITAEALNRAWSADGSPQAFAVAGQD